MAANLAAGITEEVYVSKCSAGVATATPEAHLKHREGLRHPESSAKSVKACKHEWRAHKAANRGITEEAYVSKCIAGPK
jgi:hypothetical protein